MHSGVGWHSSGAYLLRTPFNALLSGLVAFYLGKTSLVFAFCASRTPYNNSLFVCLFTACLDILLGFGCSFLLLLIVLQNPSFFNVSNVNISTYFTYVFNMMSPLRLLTCVHYSLFTLSVETLSTSDGFLVVLALGEVLSAKNTIFVNITYPCCNHCPARHSFRLDTPD